MEQTNAKIITLSLASVSALVGLTLHLLLVAFAGAFGVIARLIDSNFVRHGFPVLVAVVMFASLQFNRKVLDWAEEVIGEIKKVVWPSRKDTTAMTIVVVIMVLISSVIVTSFDFVSGYAVNHLVK